MPKVKLNIRNIEGKTIKTTDGKSIGLPPKIGNTELFDTVLPGFGLRVSPKGKRTFFVMTRINGRQVRRSVGSIQAGTKLTDARDKAREIIQDAAKGIDASSREAKKEATRQAQVKAERAKLSSVRSVSESYMTHHASKLRSYNQVKRYFDNDLLPAWGDRRIEEISRAEVRQLVRDKAVTAPIAANRVLAAARHFFNWCLDEDLIDANPASRIKPPGEEIARERVLTDGELRHVWNALDQINDTRKDHFTWFEQLIKVMVLTGQRESEVAGLKWSDLDEDTWKLAGTSTKANRGHLVALAPLTLGILHSVPPIVGQEHVFASGRAGDRPPSGFSKLKAKIDRILAEEDAELEAWRLHDLRRTFATGVTTLGIDRLTVSKCLNHAEAGVTRVYDRFARDPQKRRAWEAWAQHVETLVTGEAAPTNVVTLQRATE